MNTGDGLERSARQEDGRNEDPVPAHGFGSAGRCGGLNDLDIDELLAFLSCGPGNRLIDVEMPLPQSGKTVREVIEAYCPASRQRTGENLFSMCVEDLLVQEEHLLKKTMRNSLCDESLLKGLDWGQEYVRRAFAYYEAVPADCRVMPSAITAKSDSSAFVGHARMLYLGDVEAMRYGRALGQVYGNLEDFFLKSLPEDPLKRASSPFLGHPLLRKRMALALVSARIATPPGQDGKPKGEDAMCERLRSIMGEEALVEYRAYREAFSKSDAKKGPESRPRNGRKRVL